MNKLNKLELKKLWLQNHLTRQEWLKEQDLQHKWSIFALEIGSIFLLGIFLIMKL